MKQVRSIRDNKGFLFEVDDEVVGRCRDVRGFATALEFLQDRSGPKPERLVLIIPTIAMEDYLAKWAEDESRARRKLCITRRGDGQHVRLTATLCAYGYGVEPLLKIERVEAEESTKPARRAVALDETTQSGVGEAPMTRRRKAARRSA